MCDEVYIENLVKALKQKIWFKDRDGETHLSFKTTKRFADTFYQVFDELQKYKEDLYMRGKAVRSLDGCFLWYEVRVSWGGDEYGLYF